MEYTVVDQLQKLNENIVYLTDMLERKFGGDYEDNLNVTLRTDKAIKVINDKEDK